MQPRIDRRDVKDKDEDLTHEPEQIKAYRDTWKLGIHSYLTYLRDRLLLARDLLHESGSIFVQMNDENLHLVRCLLDEVFGRENFVSIISFAKTSGFESRTISRAGDYLIWYAKDIAEIKYRQLYWTKTKETSGYSRVELPDGMRTSVTDLRATEGRLYSSGALFSPGKTEEGSKAYKFQGRKFYPSNGHWKTDKIGLDRLANADRIEISGSTLRYVRFIDDFPVVPMNNIWEDTQTFFENLYAVQTNTKVVERCILMTTDPGDLVFDPTCGSGTTAFCAEKWGRRWITCDTSRVALNIARQRLLTARYDYYELLDPERGPAGGFKYETVPHITLESIAKNPEIDVIAAKFQPEIDGALKALNRALGKEWQEWEVPREADNRWSKTAREAHRRFWELKRAKRREIDASIQRNAPQETLYDRPLVKKGVVRVTGPFTVEAIPAPAITAPSEATPIPQFETQETQGRVNDRAGDYLADMIGLLRQQGGVLFPGGKRLELVNIRPLNLGFLHAEAESGQNGKTKRVAISFGPQYGPFTAEQANEAIWIARMNAFDILLLAGFCFDAEAQAFIQKAREYVRGLEVQFINITPDVLVGDLLKTTRASQIFTGFGEPDIAIEKNKDGTFVVKLNRVDIYDPIKGETHSASGEDVAAWFLDTDYDGMTFHICQAFFPGDPDAWGKLQRALKAQIEPEAFAKMRGTQSFPFKPGERQRIAVKVIDFRGNEVMAVREVGYKARKKS